MTTDPRAIRQTALEPYMALLESVVTGETTLADFKHRFFDLFKADDTKWAGPEYELLNDLFLDLDEFYPDPSLRDPGDLDEAQMTRRILLALEQLKVRVQELNLSVNE